MTVATMTQKQLARHKRSQESRRILAELEARQGRRVRNATLKETIVERERDQFRRCGWCGRWNSRGIACPAHEDVEAEYQRYVGLYEVRR